MAVNPQTVVDTVVTNATNKAALWSAAADQAAWDAVGMATALPALIPPSMSASMLAVEPLVPETDNGYTTFESQRGYLLSLMSDQLALFFSAYYPLNNDGYDEGTDWLVRTITLGGTGLNPAVEQQIWQRSRDRLTLEGARADSTTMLEFGRRGFALPTGVMTAQLQANRFEQLTKLQEQSRDIAIKQAEIEVENLKFAVDKAVSTRLQALASAADYIRAIIGGIEPSFRVVNLQADAKAKMMAATADLYRARLQRDEIAMRIPFKTADLTLSTNQLNVDGYYKSVDSRVRAAVAAADVYARMAQAALSSLTAIGSATVQSA